jgi:pimeloyl-ACP methyl ester carboxylesterase
LFFHRARSFNYVAAAIPNATPVIVENCGHLAPMEPPEAVNAALRAWLAG